MLISGGDVFLDDMSVSEVEEALGAEITAVPVDGAKLRETLLSGPQLPRPPRK
jgi:hypothetical protein